MQAETSERINQILGSIKRKGLRSGLGLRSADEQPATSVSLTFIDTDVLSNSEHVDTLFMNHEYGILPLCGERPSDPLLLNEISLAELQARIQSSVLFILATENIMEQVVSRHPSDSIERTMDYFGSCEVTYVGKAIDPKELSVVLAPQHLRPYVTAAGFGRVMSVPMKSMSANAFSAKNHHYPFNIQAHGNEATILVPDYEATLKKLFENTSCNIYLHVTRLPCDFDLPYQNTASPMSIEQPRSEPTISPVSVLQQHSFHAHPKGNGQIYFKNYPAVDPNAESSRESDIATLTQIGLFSFQKATTPSNLSLIAKIKTPKREESVAADVPVKMGESESKSSTLGFGC